MDMKVGARMLALLGGCALLAVPLTTHAFQDVLVTPAVKSALAPASLLNGIAVAGQRVVAVGQRGHILYSDDQGKSWTQADVPVSSDLTAVHFASPTSGWAVGHDGVVLASRDSGTTWVKQLDGWSAGKRIKDYYAAHPPLDLAGGPEALAQFQADATRFAEEGADKPFLDVWFENESTGYVVGLFNLIFRTTDGGKTWDPCLDRTDNPKLFHFYGIRSVAGDLYLVGEQGMVLRFDPTTQRFQALSIDYQGTFFGMIGKGTSLFVFGLRGHVFRSDDRGDHWEPVETGVAAAITAAALSADGRFALLAQNGQVLLSTEDGRSFIPLQGPRSPASAAVSVVPGELIVVGERGAHMYPIRGN